MYTYLLSELCLFTLPFFPGLSLLILFSFGWKYFDISLTGNRTKKDVKERIWESSMSGGHLISGLEECSSPHGVPIEEKERQRMVGLLRHHSNIPKK